MHIHNHKLIKKKKGLAIYDCPCGDSFMTFHGINIDIDFIDTETFNPLRFALLYDKILANRAKEAITQRKIFRNAIRKSKLKLFR